jgi:MFS family permease
MGMLRAPGISGARPALDQAVGARMSQKVVVGVVFVAAMFMSIMDATIVNVALPTIGRDFGVSATAVDSISIAFLVSLAVFIPASGWLGDRFGGKRVMLTAIVVFTTASALCGLASSLGELVAFRILQGAGGGMLAPVGMAMLFRAFPPKERIRASAILTVPTTFAPALGPVLGGLLVTELSWRWVFYVNVPLGAAAFVFGLLFLQQQKQDRPGRFDLAGFLLSGLGLGLLMYGVSEGPNLGWRRPDVLAWTHNTPSGAAGNASAITSATELPSHKIVITASASATASGGEPATSAPSAASGAARPEDRFHTVTSRPERSRLWAMPVPMMPVPSTATRISDLPSSKGRVMGMLRAPEFPVPGWRWTKPWERA